MDRRAKVLSWIVLLAAAGFVADRLVASLWWEPWKTAREQIQDADRQLARLNGTLKGEEKAQKDWKKVRDLLAKQRTPDVQNHFVEHLAAICDKVGVENNMQQSPPGRQGDFKEYVVDTKLKLTWAQYLDLLVELHNSRELLKPIRINISSQYDKEDRMDVDLRVSTIEWDRVPQKTGVK